MELKTENQTSETVESNGPTLITDADIVNALRENIRPAADQWARSSRAANELIKRDNAKGIMKRLQQVAVEKGPNAVISDGRNDVTIADAINIIIVALTIDAYLENPDERMGGVVPEVPIFRVAGNTL